MYYSQLNNLPFISGTVHFRRSFLFKYRDYLTNSPRLDSRFNHPSPHLPEQKRKSTIQSSFILNHEALLHSGLVDQGPPTQPSLIIRPHPPLNSRPRPKISAPSGAHRQVTTPPTTTANTTPSKMTTATPTTTKTNAMAVPVPASPLSIENVPALDQTSVPAPSTAPTPRLSRRRKVWCRRLYPPPPAVREEGARLCAGVCAEE